LDVSPTVFEILTFKARKWLVFLPLPCLTPPLEEPVLDEINPVKIESWGYKF